MKRACSIFTHLSITTFQASSPIAAASSLRSPAASTRSSRPDPQPPEPRPAGPSLRRKNHKSGTSAGPCSDGYAVTQHKLALRRQNRVHKIQLVRRRRLQIRCLGTGARNLTAHTLSLRYYAGEVFRHFQGAGPTQVRFSVIYFAPLVVVGRGRMLQRSLSGGGVLGGA